MVKLLASHGQYCRELALISALIVQESKLTGVLCLTNEIDTPLPSFQTQIFNPMSVAWIVTTFVLTPITAYYLSIMGFLPMDPISAAIDGFLVAIVYVGFRIALAYRAVRLRSKINAVE